MRYSYTFDLVPSSGVLRPLRCRVSYDGRRVDLRLGVSVDPAQWRNGRATGRFSQEANRAILRLSEALDAYFTRCSDCGAVPLRDEIRALASGGVRPGEDGSVTGLMERFTRQCGGDGGWADGTYKKFRTLSSHVRDYDSRARISDVTEGWLRGFSGHLLNAAGMRNSTVMKNMKLMRWFLNWAEREGVYTLGAQRNYRPRLRLTDGAADIVYLEWPEFEAVFGMELREGPLRAARDVFCFQCLTGLRYSDTRALTEADVAGGKVRVIMRKTGGLVEIELNRRAEDILQRWRGLLGGRALPVVGNAKYNVYIHEICRLAGLDRPHTKVWYEGGVRRDETVPLWKAVTSHAARRTFVVHALTLGIPAEVIMRWTGHHDFDAMKPYMKIVDDLKAREMRKFDL